MGDSKTVIKKVVLDVLKPLEPSIVDMATEIASVEGIENVNITSIEIDRNTESVKISVEGNDVNIEKIKVVIEKLGGVIHSVDEVTSSKKRKQTLV